MINKPSHTKRKLERQMFMLKHLKSNRIKDKFCFYDTNGRNMATG